MQWATAKQKILFSQCEFNSCVKLFRLAIATQKVQIYRTTTAKSSPTQKGVAYAYIRINSLHSYLKTYDFSCFTLSGECSVDFTRTNTASNPLTTSIVYIWTTAKSTTKSSADNLLLIILSKHTYALIKYIPVAVAPAMSAYRHLSFPFMLP